VTRSVRCGRATTTEWIAPRWLACKHP